MGVGGLNEEFNGLVLQSKRLCQDLPTHRLTVPFRYIRESPSASHIWGLVLEVGDDEPRHSIIDNMTHSCSLVLSQCTRHKTDKQTGLNGWMFAVRLM